MLADKCAKAYLFCPRICWEFRTISECRYTIWVEIVGCVPATNNHKAKNLGLSFLCFRKHRKKRCIRFDDIVDRLFPLKKIKRFEENMTRLVSSKSSTYERIDTIRFNDRFAIKEKEGKRKEKKKKNRNRYIFLRSTLCIVLIFHAGINRVAGSGREISVPR